MKRLINLHIAMLSCSLAAGDAAGESAKKEAAETVSLNCEVQGTIHLATFACPFILPLAKDASIKDLLIELQKQFDYYRGKPITDVTTGTRKNAAVYMSTEDERTKSDQILQVFFGKELLKDDTTIAQLIDKGLAPLNKDKPTPAQLFVKKVKALT